MTSVIGRRRGVKNWSKLLSDCTKKNCGYWGEGVKNLEKLLTSFMDGPLISTQQTDVENDFNTKQRPERLHLTVGNLEYDKYPLVLLSNILSRKTHLFYVCM